MVAGVFHTPAVEDKLVKTMDATLTAAYETLSGQPQVAEKVLAPEHQKLERCQKVG